MVLDVRDVVDCHHGGALFGCNAWTLSAQRIVDAGDVFVKVVHAISFLKACECLTKRNAYVLRVEQVNCAQDVAWKSGGSEGS